MKKIIINYILYVYHNYIQNDEFDNIYKEWAKPFMMVLKYIHNVYMWIFCIIFFPVILILMMIDSYMKKNRKKIKKL